VTGGRQTPATFYRIIRTAPANLIDVTSNAGLGKRPVRVLTPKHERLWDGLSVFESVTTASRQARQYPRLGTLLAEIRFQPDDAFRAERTGTAPGRWTLWADADLILRRVAGIMSVQEE
jgi:hypothetical protein